MAGVPIEVTNMVTEMQDEINRLTAELAEMKERADGELPSYTEQRCAVENAKLEDQLAEVKDRARRAAQILIEEIGAPGPENVDETATRAVSEITRLTAELARKDVELEAWRSGRLDHYGDRFALALDEHNLFKSDNIDILVDMLMAEQEEVTP